MPSCKKKNCIYYVNNKFYGCNYYFVTGQSKLSQIPKGEKYDIENCQFFDSGKKRSATKAIVLDSAEHDEVIKQVFEIDRQAVAELFNQDLCDADIAMLLETSQMAVVKVRRQKGMLRTLSKGGSIRRINWDEVDSMLHEGYSDIAIAMTVKVPLEVILRYKDLIAKKKAEGGVVSETI